MVGGRACHIIGQLKIRCSGAREALTAPETLSLPMLPNRHSPQQPQHTGGDASELLIPPEEYKLLGELLQGKDVLISARLDRWVCRIPVRLGK